MKIKLKDKEVKLPIIWEDVTFKQFYELGQYQEQLSDPIRVISILSGIPYVELFNMKINNRGIKRILSLLSFLGEKFEPEKIKCPEVIALTINDEERILKIPQDIRGESFGQKVILQLKLEPLLKEGEAQLSRVLPICFATYMMPEYFKEEYDVSKADELEKIAWQLPAHIVIPIGTFFLTNSLKSLKLKVRNLSNHYQRSNEQLALNVSKYLEYSDCLTHYQTETY